MSAIRKNKGGNSSSSNKELFDILNTGLSNNYEESKNTKKYFETVKNIVIKKTNLNLRDNEGYTPLMRALTHGVPNYELIEFLIKQGADPKVSYEDNRYPNNPNIITPISIILTNITGYGEFKEEKKEEHNTMNDFKERFKILKYLASFYTPSELSKISVLDEKNIVDYILNYHSSLNETIRYELFKFILENQAIQDSEYYEEKIKIINGKHGLSNKEKFLKLLTKLEGLTKKVRTDYSKLYNTLPEHLRKAQNIPTPEHLFTK
ncbi:MAG: ankyrin repeat domain-containing protein [Bacteroidetes bacterium]|nr:ankyrin repeat domain-containing protein [bacterium]NBP65669.1 ankyrin repeat domain-containing protein [Bacteroidota bacterium]